VTARPATRALTESQRQLVVEHRPLVLSIVGRFLRMYPKLKTLRADMEQEGMLTLVLTAGTFDPARGVRFATYSYLYVEQRIRELTRRTLNPASGAPGHQRNGTKAMYLGRESMTYPDGEPRDFPCEDPEYTDAAEVAERVHQELTTLVAMSSRSTDPERDVDVFLSGVMEPRLGLGVHAGPWIGSGLTKQRVNQIQNRVRPFFRELCASYRAEAA